MSNVVVLRPYEVDESGDKAFLDGWKKLATGLAGKEGFVRCEVFRALESGAKSPYVGVLEWKSFDLLMAAVRDPAIDKLRMHLGGRPMVYEPVEF